MADALSRIRALLTSIQVQVEGFEVLHGFYLDDPDFAKIWKRCQASTGFTMKHYSIHDGFFLKNQKLCVPTCSLRDAIVLESHQGGLAGL